MQTSIKFGWFLIPNCEGKAQRMNRFKTFKYVTTNTLKQMSKLIITTTQHFVDLMAINFVGQL